MGATSATGVSGPGDSKGKQKPDNHCGCGCGTTEDTTSEPVLPRGCVIKYSTGNSKTIRVGSSLKVRVCG